MTTKTSFKPRFRLAALALAALYLSTPAQADAVTDWNTKACDLIHEAKLGTPPAVRIVAVMQTAVQNAVQQLPAEAQPAAVAAASRATLMALIPSQQAAIESAYKASLAALPDTPAKASGVAAGERSAAAVLGARAKEAAVFAAPDLSRPHIGNVPGVYVPTVLPAAAAWSARTPWVMTHTAQFRPGPPVALNSDTWQRDYQEVKDFGGRQSSQRTAEQTEVARFWDYSLPGIYHGVVRSVALQPGRDINANARLFATVAQAMDDALIAVFDAKHHYRFWRPMTAIRNGDLDGHDGTVREAGWLPLIDNPMHPEYPSGHSILAGAVGAVLKAEVGPNTPVRLATSSPTAKGATRQWTRIDDFMQEVAMARVWGGLHYRSTNDTSLQMGRAIGELAVQKQKAMADQ